MDGKFNTSIQSYYTPAPSPSKHGAFPSASSPPGPSRPEGASNPPVGDGFTDGEIKDALKPKVSETWVPSGDYADMDIEQLSPGPKAVTFMGRIVNIYNVPTTPRCPRAAKGCVKLMLSDGTGAVTVRLWYAHLERIKGLKLGSLSRVWTNHISIGGSGTLASAAAPLFVTLFPERDRSCHLTLLEETNGSSLCSTPSGYHEGAQLPNLMTLINFINGGYEVHNARVLVVVKSVGVRKKVERKDGTKIENINVMIGDDTEEATLTLWGIAALTPSPAPFETDTTNPEAIAVRYGWLASETILLVQAPGAKVTSARTYLSVTSSTVIDINPTIPDADWLRKWAKRQKSRESVNPPFPEGIFDVGTLQRAPVRCLYTIADLDEFVRAAPGETFQGFMSILIMEINLVGLLRKHMLMAGECCGLPVYANALVSGCKGCDKHVPLRPNPKTLGTLVDETAAIGSGKMILCDQAWRDLFGRDFSSLLAMTLEGLKYLQDRLLFARATLRFGFTGDETVAGGRMCVMGVMA